MTSLADLQQRLCIHSASLFKFYFGADQFSRGTTPFGDNEEIESLSWLWNEMKSGEFSSAWYSELSSLESRTTLSSDRYAWTVLGSCRLIDLKLLCGKSARQMWSWQYM